MAGDLPAGWSHERLGDVINLKRGYDLAQGKRRPGTVPVVSSSGRSGLHDEAKVKGPGVVTGRYGTIGEVYFVDEEFWPLNTALYVQDFKGHDPRYVAALLRTINWRAYDGKSGVPGVNRNDVHEEVVALAPPAAQTRIARASELFERKAALGARMQATCEQLLLVTWQQLFGARIEGAVPLSDLVSVTVGKSYKSADLVESADTALVTLKSVRAGGGYKPDGLKPYVGDYKDSQVVAEHDLVLAATDLTQAAAVVGQPALIPGGSPFATLVLSLDLWSVRPAGPAVTVPWLLGLFHSIAWRQQALGYANGSTVLHLSKAAVGDFLVEPPAPSDLARFDEIAWPIIKRIGVLARQAATLSHMRELVLNRLVAGKSVVPQVAAGTA